MEELWGKHQNATNDGRQPTFHLSEFRDFDVFEKYLPIVGVRESKTDNVIFDTLLEYEQRGYYRVENNIVSLTERGLAKCRKPNHNWD